MLLFQVAEEKTSSFVLAMIGVLGTMMVATWQIVIERYVPEEKGVALLLFLFGVISAFLTLVEYHLAPKEIKLNKQTIYLLLTVAFFVLAVLMY